MFVSAADADVVEAAEVANGDPAGLVDPVVAHAVVNGYWRRGGAGLDTSVVGMQGRVAV